MEAFCRAFDHSHVLHPANPPSRSGRMNHHYKATPEDHASRQRHSSRLLVTRSVVAACVRVFGLSVIHASSCLKLSNLRFRCCCDKHNSLVGKVLYRRWIRLNLMDAHLSTQLYCKLKVACMGLFKELPSCEQMTFCIFTSTSSRKGKKQMVSSPFHRWWRIWFQHHGASLSVVIGSNTVYTVIWLYKLKE